MADTLHQSVLLHESIKALALAPGDQAIDCTVGAGGHTEAMLAALANTGMVLGLDRDESALALARQRLAPAVDAGRLRLVHAPFSQLADVATGRSAEFPGYQGILADIGVSSMHLDQAERGFSFAKEGPLDMRMDQSQGETAADLVNTLEEAELTRIFRDYGEEPKARPLAKAIVQERQQQPFTTTTQLAAFVETTLRRHYRGPSRRHLATRPFPALRIAVNHELEELRNLLVTAFGLLRPGGRLAVISFHSLEDRIVKRTFLDLTERQGGPKVPRDLPLTDEQHRRLTQGPGEIIKPFPVAPSDEETQANPRARSARLRVLGKRIESPSATKETP